MSETSTIPLNRSILKLSGADTRTFLQGVLTNDMDRLKENGDAVLTALLTPQGKVLFDFFLVQTEDGFFIDVATDMAADLTKRLTFYKLRADVTLTPENASVAIDPTTTNKTADMVYADPRHKNLGSRLIYFRANERAHSQEAAEAYDRHRMTCEVPEGGIDYAYGQAFAHDAMLDLLGAIDFKKGCYVGQEVVSRMHHRGTARKRIIAFETDTPLSSKTDVKSGTATLGQITTLTGTTGLATIRLDRLKEAIEAGTPVTTDGIPITFHAPEWASDLEVAS